MNFLDEIIQGIAKEYEKEKNKDQNYYEDKIPNHITKIWNDVEDILEKNNNITIKEKEDSKLNKNKVITDTIVKDLNKVKRGNRQLDKGDVVKISNGEYKGILKECKFLDYVKTMDKVLIQTDEFNRLYVNPDDIELVRKDKEKYETTTFNEIEGIYENIIVEIENDMLTVTLKNGTKSKKQLKDENKLKIMKISYYDAKIKQYLKVSQELNNIK